tara:strand:+ start:696 stop:926 length:231 start_codon:yes stop_codon:yes gene_type:complete
VEIVEIEEVPVGTSDIPAVTAVQTYAANLNRIWRGSDCVENRIRVKSVQTVCYIQIIAYIGVGVVGIPIPRLSIYI